MIFRRTKIVATLGPATDKPEVLAGIIKAGVNVVRINFSHGNKEEHIRRVASVRDYCKNNNIHIGVLMDLQGPKIRISSFKEGGVYLNEGDTFTLDADLDEEAGDIKKVGISYKKLPQEVKKGSIMLLDDGKIVLKVVEIKGGQIKTVVLQAGTLKNKKGINLKGGGLSAKALTEKDKEDILLAAELDAEYVALSFPVSDKDVIEAKKMLVKAGSTAGIIAKIERFEALEDTVIKKIIDESAGIMVARGDLGVEIGDPQLPAQQKRLIHLARVQNKVVITATQMLESMINNPIATRAEIFDVANAVLDGTDAVMLSAETATGEFPIKAVKTMADVCIEAEKNPDAAISKHRLNETFEHIEETIALSAMYAANHLGVKVLAALTASGKTALWMSRINSNIAIFAMSESHKTLNSVTLYRGVYPCIMNQEDKYWGKVNEEVEDTLLQNKVVEKGDLVVLTKGLHRFTKGGTNLMKILRIGDS